MLFLRYPILANFSTRVCLEHQLLVHELDLIVTFDQILTKWTQHDTKVTLHMNFRKYVTNSIHSQPKCRILFILLKLFLVLCHVNMSNRQHTKYMYIMSSIDSFTVQQVYFTFAKENNFSCCSLGINYQPFPPIVFLPLHSFIQ